MLEVTGLTKRYGGVLALDGCSLQVPAGHLVGLLGPPMVLIIVIGALYAHYGDLPALWRKYGDTVTRQQVQEHPGTRPVRWWWWTTPSCRRCGSSQ